MTVLPQSRLPQGSPGWGRLAGALLLVVICGVASAAGTRLPLTTGEEVECEIIRVGGMKSGLLVRLADGREVQYAWDEVSTKCELHPRYGRPAAPPRPPQVVPGPPAAPAPPVPAPEVRPRRPRGAEAERERPAPASAPPRAARMGLVLFGVLAWFWLCILSVWLVSREHLVGGGIQQNWNLAALLFGPPAALLFLVRMKGISGLFRRTEGPHPSKGAVAVCTLFTWDGKPLQPIGGKKRSTGLISAQALLGRAVQLNASDVHFDTTTYGIDVKYRVDGVLREPEVLTPDLGRKTVAAIKMAAGMDVIRVQEAQDGACHMAVNDVWYDLRIARAWAVNGETLVVRLLKATGVSGDLTDLGMSKEMADEMQNVIQESAGIIIVAGPTGSGKTSTLYALLRKIVNTGRNILTIEDPVEYRLEGATQISLNARIGNTFASALKASMRHDPDVILVGEIRDSDTMDVAFQAGLTGHLVFTTIHATSVLATIGRLHEMGLSSYMINTGLKTIVCQRLVRLLCPTCRQAYTPNEDELGFWGLTPEVAQGKFFYKPGGCQLCQDSGFHGRRAVYRMLFMNNDIRKMIRPDVATGDLQRIVDRHALGDPTSSVKELLWTGVTAPLELQRTLDMFDFGKYLGAREQAAWTEAPPEKAVNSSSSVS